MYPNNPQVSPGAPANLPQVSPTGQPQQQNNASMQPPSSMVSAAAHYAAQTKRLVEQYGNDPYQLSAAIGQLKTTYLSEQFHITPNQADH